MSFTVNQRRREIGIRSALGASTRLILTSVLARATRQLALGVGLGLAAAVALDLAAGGELMGGTGLLLVPATAAFMLVVGLLAAAGPARRGPPRAADGGAAGGVGGYKAKAQIDPRLRQRSATPGCT